MNMGVDVSSHNARIDWEKAKTQIDFAFIRAGFGAGNYDLYAQRNFAECNRLKIPCGAYWFSYALNVEQAEKEADYICDLLKNYKIELPVAFDFESDSIAHAKRNNVNIGGDLMCKMAVAFLDRISLSGYTPMLYSNIDFLRRGFSKISAKYPLWFAQWGVKEPSKEYKCAFWQWTDNAKIPGIPGTPDGNISFTDINNITENGKITDDLKTLIAKKLPGTWWKEKIEIAHDVINGKFGNGEERKTKLKKAGFDPVLIQTIVNFLLGC